MTTAQCHLEGGLEMFPFGGKDGEKTPLGNNFKNLFPT